MTILHILARGSHWWHTEAVQYVLEHGADVTLADGKGCTPLHVAVCGGYRRHGIVQALLKHGADPNAVDSKSNVPLNHTTGDPEMARLLIRHGADVTLGHTPILCAAIEEQDVETVQAILDAGIDCNKAFRDNISSVEAGADSVDGYYSRFPPHESGEHLRYAPLRFAARLSFDDTEKHQKAVNIVQMLLDHGADPFKPATDETTIMHDVFSQGGTFDPLLALPGLDLEKRDGRGRTLLLAACVTTKDGRIPMKFRHFPEQSRAGLVRRLCDMGADVSAVDNDGNNVLHLLIAAMEGGSHEQIIASLFPFLIETCPALLHQQDGKGYKPLHRTVQKYLPYTCKLLMEAGADPMKADPAGNTILHRLVRHVPNTYLKLGRADLEEALRLGIDINARNGDGDTPLARYILSFGERDPCYSLRDEGHQEIVQCLREAGADFFTRNNAGESLLHLVARLLVGQRGLGFGGNGSHESFTYLMEMGLDPFLEDRQQRSPVDVAAAYGKKEILALFQNK